MILAMQDMAARAATKTFREYHGSTTVHPVGITVLIGLVMWMFVAARQRAIIPVLVLICFIPSAQRIVVFGADFTYLRIMAIAGLFRALVRSEFNGLRLNRIDYVYMLWVLVGSVVYIAQQGDVAAAVYVAGTSVDMLGGYFLARVWIRNIEDLYTFARALAILALAVSVFFGVELLTQRNMFAIFGGVPEITIVRDYRLRCQGAFSHAILAGVFWAAVGAFLMGAALGKRHRFLFATATAACVGIIVASASSTPVLGFAAGVAFWLAWPLRGLMRYAFIGAPFMLLGLHMVMEAPVWHLVSRVSAVGGSTGYHRFVLIDGAIRHFHEWWLVGSTWTGHWSEYFQTWDITNQYIFEGVRGGVWRLILFLMLVYLVGRSIATAQGRARSRGQTLLLWGLGASFFVHCVCFIGVSYFGQIVYLWYITLGIGGSLMSPSFFPATTKMRLPEVDSVRY